MSQHPSLRVDKVGTRHRNVLKRFERIKKLQEGERWTEGRTVYNLPKVRSIKIKAKKAKSDKAAAAPGAVAAPAAAATTTAAKPAAGAKPAAAKDTAKK